MVKRKQNGTENSEEATIKQFQNFINVFDDEFFWIKDESGNIFFSDNLSEVTGFSSADLKSISEIIYDVDRASYKKLYHRALDNSLNEMELEYRIITKDEKIKWVKEIVKIFRDENGKIIRTIGRVTDISKIKRSEVLLKEDNKQLKERDAAKDSFLNLLSHDLRSPFTSILGFTEILLKESSMTGPERIEYLAYIHSSSEKLLQFINYLLDWSKLKSGKLKINMKKINLRSLIYNCVSSLTGTAVKKNIEIKVETESSLQVRGDERLLNIVITNLVSNAIKFSERGSKVFIKTSQFNNDYFELTAIDKGVGIPEENKIKMFKMENMFSTQDTMGEKGTGFGLILSKEIIEKHGGQLWFYSEEKKGSEFHITLPLFKEVIMIIETDNEKKNSIATVIEKNYRGYKIITAANSYEAINNAVDITPSLIIMNHDLPLMNGLQLIESIVNDRSDSELKLIILSDPLTERQKNSYERFGKVTFLKKSVAVESILNVLKDMAH